MYKHAILDIYVHNLGAECAHAQQLLPLIKNDNSRNRCMVCESIHQLTALCRYADLVLDAVSTALRLTAQAALSHLSSSSCGVCAARDGTGQPVASITADGVRGMSHLSDLFRSSGKPNECGEREQKRSRLQLCMHRCV